MYCKASVRKGAWTREGLALSLLVVRVGNLAFYGPHAHALSVPPHEFGYGYFPIQASSELERALPLCNILCTIYDGFPLITPS